MRVDAGNDLIAAACARAGLAQAVTPHRLLLTGWPEFAGLRPDRLGSVVARRNIVDGRTSWIRLCGGTPGGITALGVAKDPAALEVFCHEAKHHG
jgi:hypothetical protein